MAEPSRDRVVAQFTQAHQRIAEIVPELDAIQGRMAELTCETAAGSKEPVTVEGWYENTDGTCSRITWTRGSSPRVQATLRSPGAIGAYAALGEQGAALFMRLSQLREDVRLSAEYLARLDAGQV